jgi:hypothetical protein
MVWSLLAPASTKIMKELAKTEHLLHRWADEKPIQELGSMKIMKNCYICSSFETNNKLLQYKSSRFKKGSKSADTKVQGVQQSGHKSSKCQTSW